MAKYKPRGDTSRMGALLVGIEGSMPCTVSQQGDNHGIKCDAKKWSAFFLPKWGCGLFQEYFAGQPLPLENTNCLLVDCSRTMAYRQLLSVSDEEVLRFVNTRILADNPSLDRNLGLNSPQEHVRRSASNESLDLPWLRRQDSGMISMRGSVSDDLFPIAEMPALPPMRSLPDGIVPPPYGRPDSGFISARGSYDDLDLPAERPVRVPVAWLPNGTALFEVSDL